MSDFCKLCGVRIVIGHNDSDTNPDQCRQCCTPAGAKEATRRNNRQCVTIAGFKPDSYQITPKKKPTTKPPTRRPEPMKTEPQTFRSAADMDPGTLRELAALIEQRNKILPELERLNNLIARTINGEPTAIAATPRRRSASKPSTATSSEPATAAREFKRRNRMEQLYAFISAAGQDGITTEALADKFSVTPSAVRLWIPEFMAANAGKFMAANAGKFMAFKKGNSNAYRVAVQNHA